MKSFASPVAALLLSLLVGCQSTSWSTALKSKFSRDKSKSVADDEPANDLRLVSEDKLNGAGRYRGRQSNGDARIAGQGGSRKKFEEVMRNGHLAQQVGQLQQAKMFYQQALDIDSRNPLAHHKLAIIADQQSDFKQAEEHYLAALSVNRHDPNLLSDMGYSLLLQSQYNNSKYYLQKALEEEPTHTRALNNLGLLHAKQGNYDGALAMFRQTGDEAKVQSKMQELFPNGPPRSNGVGANQGSQLAFGQQQLPQVTPAGGTPAWEEGGIQVTGGTQAPAAAGFGQQNATPNSASRPFPNDLDAQSTIDFRQKALPQPHDPDPRLAGLSNQQQAPQPNSNQLPTNPLAYLQEFGPPGQQQGATPQRQAIPLPAGQAPPAKPFQDASQFAADQFQASPDQFQNASNSVVTNPAFKSTVRPDVNPAQPVVRPRYHSDPRQQAAIMGLNAGSGGMFPVMHSDPHAQPGLQPNASPPVVPQSPSRPVDVNSAPADNPARNIRRLPITAAGQYQPRHTQHQQQGYAPAVNHDPRHRTAARPVTQPAATRYQPQGDATQQPFQQRTAQPYQQSPQYNPQPRPAAPTQYAPQQQPAYNTQPTTGTQPLPQQYRPATVTPRATEPFNPGRTYPRQ